MAARNICPICSARRHYLYRWQGFPVFRCEQCETESVDPPPTQAELQAFYQCFSETYMDRRQTRLRLVERAFDHYLAEYQKITGRQKPAVFLDIGGGVGYYARAALNQKINACLMDYAADGLAFAHKVLKVSWTVQGNVQKCASLLAPASFDFVLARHVVEHVLDPEEFIANVAQVMCQGGLLEIETPNVNSREQFAHPLLMVLNYQIIRQGNRTMPPLAVARQALSKSMSGVNPPKHLWGFTAKGLTLILERCGFEVLKVRQAPAGHRVFDPLYYDFRCLSTRRKVGVPYYFVERILSLFFKNSGMNLAILARLQ